MIRFVLDWRTGSDINGDEKYWKNNEEQYEKDFPVWTAGASSFRHGGVLYLLPQMCRRGSCVWFLGHEQIIKTNVFPNNSVGP